MNMSKYSLLFFFALCFATLHAQTPLSEATRKADTGPAWPGCDPKLPDCTKSRLTDFINANLQIPTDAKKESIGGVVAMEFVIEKNGEIGEIHAMHDPGMGLVPEATRVINLLNAKKIKFIPAELDNKRIAYRYIIPVSFNIAAPPKEKMEVKMATQPVDGIYDIAEVMPRYHGCENAGEDSVDCTFRKMIAHIKSNLQYPEEAKKLKAYGQVVVEFVVDTNGAVTKPTIKQGLGAGLDDEALRIVSLMPAWAPGKQGGHAVPVRMRLPIYFQLPKEE
jgi:TonB family protein